GGGPGAQIKQSDEIDNVIKLTHHPPGRPAMKGLRLRKPYPYIQCSCKSAEDLASKSCAVSTIGTATGAKRPARPPAVPIVADAQEAKPSMQGVDYVIHLRPSGVLTVPLA